MSSQNFDPEWAQHLKHDPDKPLGVGIPEPTITWDKCLAISKQHNTPKGQLAPTTHDANLRPAGSMAPSQTWIAITLRLVSGAEELVMPCETATTVGEVIDKLAFKVMRSPDDIFLVRKLGFNYKQLYRHEQVSRLMMVRGIESFTRQRQRYKDPKVIIGAGHLGLRMAMFLNRRKDYDFVVFDRMFRVGGTSWMYQANSTSKLQTEYGAYHLDYGEEYPIPNYFTTPWPSRNALLEMFQKVSEEEGIMPYIRLNTNVASMDLGVAFKGGPIEKYTLRTEKMEAGRLKFGRLVVPEDGQEGEQESFNACSICMFPGNLTLPRMETYKGEEEFDGDIGYAMFNEVNYDRLEGEDATIIGHGAFAVENIRTCCEFGVHQIYLVCRRRNLACPRVASWMANRTLMPLNNVRYMKVTELMYELISLDPWSYHSVHANEKRTTCNITQKARFGIGDIYFLSIYMGKVEVIVEPGGVKRISRHTVHLASSRKLPCRAILKLLGLVGEMDNDRLLQIKEMEGFWVNGDPRRYIVAEPVSVMCNQMGGTSFSPGAYSWSLQGLYFLDFPGDFFAGPQSSGMLPKHKVDLSDDGTPRPAYVVDARHGTQTGMTVGMFTPGLQEIEANSGFVKAVRHRLCHPIKKFLAQAKEDWDYYAAKMLAEGFGVLKPYPEYPYTPQVVNEMYDMHIQDAGEPRLPGDEQDIALCLEISG